MGKSKPITTDSPKYAAVLEVVKDFCDNEMPLARFSEIAHAAGCGVGNVPLIIRLAEKEGVITRKGKFSQCEITWVATGKTSPRRNRDSAGCIGELRRSTRKEIEGAKHFLRRHYPIVCEAPLVGGEKGKVAVGHKRLEPDEVVALAYEYGWQGVDE